MVLPIRVSAKDATSKIFTELAHTLDIGPRGARLGAIRHQLKKGEILTIQYKQRKMQFKVVWVRGLEGTKEYQIGIETMGAAPETWGLEISPNEPGDDPAEGSKS
jgi:hypothetical protein